MKRTSLTAGLAVAGLLGGGVILVFLWTRPPRSIGLPPAPSDAGATLPASASPSAPAAAPPAAPLRSRAPASGPSMARASWSASTQDPSSPPMASRVIRKVVRRALLAAPVQSRLARCADQAGGFGGPAEGGPNPRGKPALLMLELEALGGEVRIVEARVREWGSASEATASCARDVLRGRIIPAATVHGGGRMRMPFPLSPRSEAVASSR